MANTTKTFNSSGSVTIPTWDRADFTQETGVEYCVPLTLMRVHDAMHTVLPGTASSDDMALITGTPGTDAPTLQGVDFGNTSTDEKCAFIFQLPAEYTSGQAISVVVRGGMVTTVANGSCNVDIECWCADGNGGVGGDICATAAQTINSLTPASRTFTITPTGRQAGDPLVIRLSFVGTDSGDAGVMIPEIQKVSVLLNIKG